MTTKNINIKAGDIPETDEEVEKILAKKPAKRPSPRLVSSLRSVPPTGQLVHDPAEAAANTEDYQGEAVPDEKPAKVKKVAKPKKEKVVKARSATNPNGYSWIDAHIVVGVFADAPTMKRAEIATKHNISLGSVSTILTGPKWFVDRFTPRLAAIGVNEYPKLVQPAKAEPKKTAKKGESK